jgi:hypothetical protein
VIAALAMVTATATCFWSYPRDLPLVETNVRYWRGEFRLKPGERIELAGDFPHARQLGFNVHRAADNAVLAGMPDEAIEPVAGATNPFRPGADRRTARRGFAIEIAGGSAVPGRRIGLGSLPADGFAGRVLMRLYLPDAARLGGGVALPRATLVHGDGAREALGGACPDPASIDPIQPTGPTRIPEAAGTVAEPLDWRSSGLATNTASGDVMVNRDNAYAYAYTDFRRGEALVLHGRAPTHPWTLRGDRPMGTGQVRYWSLCAYRHPSDRTARCLADEEIPLDRRGRYTVIVSPAALRPANARAACGVGWIDATTPGEGLMLLRHVAPSQTFRFSPVGGAASAPAAPLLGEYLPAGRYVARAAFERLGCPARYSGR